MITIDIAKERILRNTEIFKKQKETNSFDLKQYYGVDAEAGQVSCAMLSKKAHDILASVALGFLPILTKITGPDAIKLDGIIFTPVELKSSFTDETKFIKTVRGTVYSATPGKIVNNTISPNNVTNLKSCYNATYSIKDNISLKGIDTYLVIFDSRNDDIIDCFCISAERMIIYFNSRRVAASGSLQIKLAEFMDLGKQFSTVIPMIGFEKWKNTLLPVLPVVNVTHNDETKRKMKVDRLVAKLINQEKTILLGQELSV